MRFNKNDSIQENANISSSAIQVFQGRGAIYLLTAHEEELCEYLVTRHQNPFPLTDERKYEFQQDHRLFAETIRRNVVNRKADFS
jgi:hypothetical protein